MDGKPEPEQAKPAAVTTGDDGDLEDPSKFQMLSDDHLNKLREQGSAQTGHEDEENIATVGPAKLYRFSEGQWKGRGTGAFEFYKNTGDGKVRIVLRENKTGKLRLNHYLNSNLIIQHQQNDPKSWTWAALDRSDDADADSTDLTPFAARFPSPEGASEFHKWFKGE